MVIFLSGFFPLSYVWKCWGKMQTKIPTNLPTLWVSLPINMGSKPHNTTWDMHAAGLLALLLMHIFVFTWTSLPLWVSHQQLRDLISKALPTRVCPFLGFIWTFLSWLGIFFANNRKKKEEDSMICCFFLSVLWNVIATSNRTVFPRNVLINCFFGQEVLSEDILNKVDLWSAI